MDLFKIITSFIEKDGLCYIFVTATKGRFKGLTGVALPQPNNLVHLTIGEDYDNLDGFISKEQFNKEFLISGVEWSGSYALQ